MIFGFRGSDINSFFSFVDEFKLKKFFLDQNYRSTQTIVDASRTLISHNDKQFEKHPFSTNAEGNPIVYYHLPSEVAEASRVTKIVKVLNRNGIPYHDMAILYRMSYQSRKIEDSFLKNNIPYRMLSGVPFYARKEIKDVMAYLKFLINPEDQLAFERAVNCPKRGIGESSLVKLTSCLFGTRYDTMTLDVLDAAIEDSGIRGKAKKGYKAFVSIMHELAEAKETSKPDELLERLVGITGYLPFLEKEDADTYEDRKKNIEELCQMASEYETLEDFVGNMIVNEVGEDEEDDQNPFDTVNMMTIHGSKGLEFKVVIVIGCNQGVIPHFKAILAGDVSEERRLFYVAMTRAKEFLFFTRSETTFRREKLVHQMPSVFLKEIDPKYIIKR